MRSYILHMSTKYRLLVNLLSGFRFLPASCLPAVASGDGDEGEADSRRPGGGCQADGATEGRGGPRSCPQEAEDRRRGGAGQRGSRHHGTAASRGEVRHP